MNMVGLALRNIRGNSIRSLIIFLCVLGVAGFFVATTLIVRGAENSLNRGLERLGADIIAVPPGTEQRVESALLMGKPTNIWMPKDFVGKLAAVPGVEKVSPQIYLSSMFNSACCSVSEMFVVVYDPATDFALTPWLEKNLGRELKTGEVIGGTYIFTPLGEKYIKLYGYDLTLKGNLEATGTGIDQTMFMNIDTAKAMAASSRTTAARPLVIPADSISSVLIKVGKGVNRHRVALDILLDVAGVVPIESPSLFGSFRDQMMGLLWGLLALLSMAWVLSAVLIGLVFSIASNERQREIAVLRSLGATHLYIFGSLIAEASMIALVGGVLGISLGAFGIYMFKDYIAGSLKMPFLFPDITAFLGLFALVIVLSLMTVTLGAVIPAARISRSEPAVAMRE